MKIDELDNHIIRECSKMALKTRYNKGGKGIQNLTLLPNGILANTSPES